MAWETMTGEIMLQDGTGAFLFTAAGTIKKGQQVASFGDGTIISGSDNALYSDSIGVALYDATEGQELAVAGPGNIVMAAADADIAPGSPVYGDTDGIFDATAGNAVKIGGIVTKSEGTAIDTSNYYTEILLI